MHRKIKPAAMKNEGQCAEKSSHWETRIGQNLCKKESFIEKKDSF